MTIARADLLVAVHGRSIPVPSIYGLRDAADPSRIRYVGKAERDQSRPWAHYENRLTRRSKVSTWCQKLFLAGRRYDVVVLEALPMATRDVVNDAERKWIASLATAGHRLLNMTPGGDGALLVSEDAKQRHAAAVRAAMARPDVAQRILAAWQGEAGQRRRLLHARVHVGRRLSAEARQRVSAANSGRVPWNKGRAELRPEVRARISAAAIGRVPWNKGRARGGDIAVADASGAAA